MQRIVSSLAATIGALTVATGAMAHAAPTGVPAVPSTSSATREVVRHIDQPDDPIASGFYAAEDALSAGAMRADGSFISVRPPSGPYDPLEPLSMESVNPFGTGFPYSVAPIPGTDGFLARYPPVVISGVDGYDWLPASIPVAEAPPNADGSLKTSDRLLATDDLGRVVRSIRMPQLRDGLKVIATSGGLRTVSTTETNVTIVIDERGHTVARAPHFQADQVVAGPGGDLFMTGFATKGHYGGVKFRQIVLRVTPRGRITVARVLSPRVQADKLVAALPSGLLYLIRGAVEDPELVLRGATGRAIRRTRSGLGVEPSPDCVTRGIGFQLAPFASPSGQEMVRLDCLGDGGRDYYVLQSTLVGLDARLRVRWSRDVSPPDQYQTYAPVTGPTGKLITTRFAPPAGINVTAATVPDAAPIPRGKVLRLGRDNAGPYLRVGCDHPEGMVCNGQAELIRNHRVVAKVKYALLARPGAKAAVATRHFPGPKVPRGRLSVRLRPVTGGF